MEETCMDMNSTLLYHKSSPYNLCYIFQALCGKQIKIKFKFTFMHLADTFIQSDIQQRIGWYLLFTENPTECSILQ